MKSMTGYGSAEITIGESRLHVAVRSLNGRFLEIRLHAPREFISLESRIKKHVSKKVNRGNVDLFISRKGVPNIRLKVHDSKVREWMSVYNKLAKVAGLELSPALLVRLAENPHVVEAEESSGLNSAESRLVDRCIDQALVRLDNERRREGLALKRELLKILAQLQKVLLAMKRVRADAKAEIEKRMRKRLAELQDLAAVDPERFHQELIFQMDRSDIREEMARLEEHLQQCLELVRGGQSDGRKLDFYTQELLREINTIGSKSGLAELTKLVVEAKGFIENFKEQVQNVE